MKRPYLKYLAALLLFGSNGIVASHISLSSYEIVLLRTLLGAVLLLGIWAFFRPKPACLHAPKDLLFLAISGIAMGASWMLLYEAYAQVGVSVSTLLYYCGPVIVMALSPVLFHERLTWEKILGFLCVFAGVIFLNGRLFSGFGNPFGVFCGILSAVMYSVMVAANKKAQRITGMENAVLQLLISFFTVAVFVVMKNGFALRVEPADWPWILVLGCLNTGLGCYLYFSSIGKLPVQTVAVLGYLEPLSAVLFSMAFLSEKLLPMQLLGGGLMLGGAVFGERFHSKRKKNFSQ